MLAGETHLSEGMDPDRWRQISRLYHAARARAGEERRAFLNSACGGDAALRHEVESLLADATRAETVVAAPAAESFADLPKSDAQTADGAAQPARILEGYRIERLLGRGGMGAVFLAYDTTLHRQVALKMMDGATDGETSHGRLLREARNAAALNHPNICMIHEVGDASGAAFIAMEYVEGRSLRDRIDQGALPLDEAVRCGIQAADALAYAHDHGVVHRDFKAANAIVTETGRLKIVDFGLARRGDALMTNVTTMASLVPAGTAAGTPYAMAPEQVRGDATDPRTDIWALGVLLYEMVAGIKPFNAATIPELFSSILRDPPAPLPDAVPVQMRVLIERCLDKEPGRRHQHAGEVRAALDAIQAGTAAPWIAWRYHLIRRRWLSSAAALLGVGAVLVGFNLDALRDRLGAISSESVSIKLAVLPFENLTGDPEQEYFSDGLTEDMITQLGRLHPQRLSVIGRTSSMRYKKSEKPVDQIGRELGVDYVLEGSARQERGRVKINATLVRVSDQTQRWSDSYERELTSILAVQGQVARGIARSLSLALLPAEASRLANARVVNPEAYEAYMKGLYHLSKMSRADHDAAQRYFELALQKDPGYALPYLGLWRVWSYRDQLQFWPRDEARSKADAALTQALLLDDTSAEAHLALATKLTWWDWEFARAESEFRRGLELNPNLADARAIYADYLIFMKRPSEASAEIQRALQLDPLNAMVRVFSGRILLFLRRYDDAIAECREALKTDPNSPIAHGVIQQAMYQKRSYGEALAWERSRQLALGQPDVVAALDRGFAEGGFAGAMRRAAENQASRSRVSGRTPIAVASLYLRAGDKERALEWLERSYAARDNAMPYLSIAPIYDSLRGDPRFQNLLRRMNLPM